MTGWDFVKLSDICTITMGQSPKSSFYNNIGEGIPFLQGNRTFGIKYPLIDTYTTKITKIAKKNDIIMSVRAPVGDINIAPTQLCLGRGLCGFNSNNGAQTFLYYLLTHNINKLKQKETGTVFGSVNKKDIEELMVKVPKDIKDQKKIASILSALDDKIELNNKINKNLEEMAQAIFINSFPNYRSGDKCIGDFITPKRGKGLLSKNAIIGKVPVVAGGLAPSTYHNEANTIPPVISISASGANAGYVNLWEVPIWSSDSSFIDTTISLETYFWYLLLKLRQQEIFDSQTGSAQPHIYPKHIMNMRIPNFKIEGIHMFTEQVTPLFNKIGKNKEENKNLTNLRDTLLPKLMSGELDVSNLEI